MADVNTLSVNGQPKAVVQDGITVGIFVSKRWFFWPAILTISLLGKLGILRDPQKAGKWLADHAMRIEVR